MIVTIDAAGRIVVPKSIREEAGLHAGEPLQIRCRDGRVEIEPAPRQVRRVREGRVAVAQPVEIGKPLGTDAVRRTQRILRQRRS